MFVTRLMASLARPAVVAALALAFAPAARAQTDFYAGKTITIVVGFTPGGGYDLNARAVSRFLGNHIPGNPKIIIQNMPGAGSLTSINHLANIAAKDGTALATFSRGIMFEPLMGNKQAQFDPRKLNWIGSPSRETNLVFVRDAAPFRSFDDLKTKEMAVATTGAGADTATFPLIVNAVFNTKMKVVSGYPGANEMLLAVERGEVDGMGGLSWGLVRASRPAWVKDNKIRILLQLAMTRAPDLPNVPTAMEIVQAPADRQLLELFFARLTIAWPIAAPGNVPADRIAILKQAFAATMKDPEYLAEAAKQGLDVTPVSGEEITQILESTYASPAPVIERARVLSETSN